MIETDRLILRRWSEDDAEDLFRYASDSRVSEMALWPCHTSLEMSREVIRQYFAPNEYTFAVVCKQTDEVIGCIGLVPDGDEHYALKNREREVGYWIGYPHWGRGFATEALLAFILYCRESVGLESLLLTTDMRNKASRRVAEKCGFGMIGGYDYDGIDSMAFRKVLML